LEPFTEPHTNKPDDSNPKENTSTDAKNSTKAISRYRLVKRLAVTTAQRTYSGHILELLHTSDAETILAVLTRKVSEADKTCTPSNILHVTDPKIDFAHSTRRQHSRRAVAAARLAHNGIVSLQQYQ